ncbi:nucleoside-diphosphate kinase [candidate division WWE3 bacterium]|nr:nucleoside-diphosphate kinase [candidate division WWE3 bacterium]
MNKQNSGNTKPAKFINTNLKQRTLILLKPDAVKRGITGEIIDRFEQTGLKIVGAKLIKADRGVAQKHYKKDAAWHKKVGEYNLKDCEDLDVDPMEIFGTTDPTEIGSQVNEWLFSMFDEGPVFAFVFEGPNAVKKVRTLVGSTYPDAAPPGTIRGDYGLDSAVMSMQKKRALLNLIHASGTVEEAQEEISIWFSSEELLDYRRADEDVYHY